MRHSLPTRGQQSEPSLYGFAPQAVTVRSVPRGELHDDEPGPAAAHTGVLLMINRSVAKTTASVYPLRQAFQIASAGLGFSAPTGNDRLEGRSDS